MSELKGSPRILGFDLIRMICFVPICFFHGTLIYFYTPAIEMAKSSRIIHWAEVFTRSLAFSGFVIVFLSSLLISYSSTSLARKSRLFILLLIGWIFLSQLMQTRHVLLLAWDIYPLFIVGLLSSFALERIHPDLSLMQGSLGALLLWVPFWKFGSHFEFLGTNWRNVLGFADCSREVADWPIFPWIGLVWLGAAWGQYLRYLYSTRGSPWLPFHKQEILLWVFPLALSIKGIGPYYNVRLGDFFTCDYYRQEPTTFWSYFIWVCFVLRLMVTPKVQRIFESLPVMIWLSQRTISKKYWLAYMTAYGLIHIMLAIIPGFVLAVCPEYYGTIESIFFPLMVFAFIPLTEFVCTRLVINAQSLKRTCFQLKVYRQDNFDPPTINSN